MYLVTGGAGFIGGHLLAALRRRGLPHRALDLVPPAAPAPIPDAIPTSRLAAGDTANVPGTEITSAAPAATEWIVADIRDEAALRPAMRDVSVVIHLAADASVARSLADPATTFAINLNGTLNVLTAARDAGVRRLVLASSCAVYGDAIEGPAREEQAPAPLTPYAMSKLIGEYLAAMCWREHGLETVALRYFNVYGPGQRADAAYAAVIPAFAAALRTGRRPLIDGDGEQSRDFVAVADVVRATLLAAERPGVAGRVFNVGTGQATTINQVLALMSDILGVAAWPEHRPARPGDIRRSVADPARATAGLGFTAAVPLAAGLGALLSSNPGIGGTAS